MKGVELLPSLCLFTRDKLQLRLYIWQVTPYYDFRFATRLGQRPRHNKLYARTPALYGAMREII